MGGGNRGHRLYFGGHLHAAQQFSREQKSLKQILQNAYPQYQVIEKQQDLIICEVDHRNLLQELVMIRIDPQQKKNMRTFGRRVTFTYPKPPALREMRKDFAVYLSTH